MSLEQTRAIPVEMSYDFNTNHLKALSLEQLYLFEENPKVAEIYRVYCRWRRVFQKNKSFEL